MLQSRSAHTASAVSVIKLSCLCPLLTAEFDYCLPLPRHQGHFTVPHDDDCSHATAGTVAAPIAVWSDQSALGTLGIDRMRDEEKVCTYGRALSEVGSLDLSRWNHAIRESRRQAGLRN